MLERRHSAVFFCACGEKFLKNFPHRQEKEYLRLWSGQDKMEAR